MRPPLALAAALSLAAGAASAQAELADLLGQPVYDTGGTAVTSGTDSVGVTEASPDWTQIGRVAGVGTLDGAPVALLDLEGVGTDVPVTLDRLQVIEDADNPGTMFVLSQADARSLASGAEGIERDRLSGVSAADGTVFEEDSATAAEGGEARRETGEATVIVVGPNETAAEPAQAQPEGPRVVDIADPDAPPIENAEEVVPELDPREAEVPGLEAETEFRPSSQSAATPLELGEADVRPASAPENFAPVDMTTLAPTELLNVRVYTLDGENIGQIDRWVGEAEGRFPEGAVVNVGGFLGIGSRDIAIDTDKMTLLAQTDGNGLRVYVDATREEIENLPELPD